MDDMIGKLNELLSDEESVRQLSELAKMITSDKHDSDGGSESSEADMPDMSSIMKLTGLLGSVTGKDKDTELLLALKPHLKEKRQERIDKAVKLLRVIALWEAAKESGILNDLI